MPLVHYNIPRSKRFLLADDYLRPLDAGCELIGVKFTFAGANFGALQEAVMRVPGVSFFVAEHLLVSGMLLGARGSCSSLALTNPAFVLEMYTKARARKWEAAVPIETRAAFFSEWAALVEGLGEGMIDPTAAQAGSGACGPSGVQGQSPAAFAVCAAAEPSDARNALLHRTTKGAFR